MAPLSNTIDQMLYMTCEGAGNDQSNSMMMSSSSSSSSCLPPLHQTNDETSSSTSRKFVSFSESLNVEITFCLHRNDMTKDERSASWYSKDEIRTIKNGVRAAVQTLTNFPNQPDDDIHYTSRGIENRTREGARRKLQNKVDARAAVFFEQEVQQEEGLYDVDLIADCYYEYSEHCHAAAHMAALRDEQEAKAIYATPSKDEVFVSLSIGGIAGNNGPVVQQVASSAA